MHVKEARVGMCGEKSWQPWSQTANGAILQSMRLKEHVAQRFSHNMCKSPAAFRMFIIFLQHQG